MTDPNERGFREFCECESPQFEDEEVHEQYGGDIVSRFIGRYCTKCGGAKPIKNSNDE